MKRIISGFAVLLTLAACSENRTENGQVYSAIEASGENDAEFNKETSELAKKEAEAEAKAAASITSMKLDKEFHDFGSIATGSENYCEFKVTNTGKNPLIIE